MYKIRITYTDNKYKEVFSDTRPFNDGKAMIYKFEGEAFYVSLSCIKVFSVKLR